MKRVFLPATGFC